MKIAVFIDEGWEREFLAYHLAGHELLFLAGPDAGDTGLVYHDVECVCVFIKTPVHAGFLDRFPQLRGVVTRSTGYDHIDLEEAAHRNVTVSNVPAYGENTIAEYAFALLLSLTRQVYETYSRVREAGTWSTNGLDGMDLKGKKFAVVGTGHTGQHAIRIARGFGMEAIAFDVHERKELEAELGFMYVTFDDLLAQADVVSLHAPYNEHTHHMFNETSFGKLKRGAILINTARGGLVDTRALVGALEGGVVSGAGLDVLEEEGRMNDLAQLATEDAPDPCRLQVMLANQYLIDHAGVLVMPHNAFNTKEARERILQTTVENVEAVAAGAPQNVVG